MARTTVISKKELQRAAAAAYEGKTLKVMLCNVGTTGYTEESTVANWQSVEVSGNGYTRYSTTVGTGAYDNTAGAYVIPTINAAFTATGAGFSYDTVVIYIDGQTYVHSVATESPNVTVAASQTQTYPISLQTDY